MDYNTLVTEEEQRLSRVPVTALYEALGQVKDGRKKRGCRYSLALLLLARLAGETELRGAAHWIKLRKEWIVEHFHVKRATVPCLGTYLYAAWQNRCARATHGGGRLCDALGSG